MIDVPLGPSNPTVIGADRVELPKSTFRPFRPRVDGIVVTTDTLYLIEAKIMRIIDGMCKLPFYSDLIPSTPELQPYWTLPVKMILVAPSVPGWAAILATRHDITIEFYAPDWIEAYMEKQQYYLTGAARQGRAKRQEVLRSLGYTELA
jgi:hypothetical protein